MKARAEEFVARRRVRRARDQAEPGRHPRRRVLGATRSSWSTVTTTPIRDRSTLGAIAELAGAGYVSRRGRRRPRRLLSLPANRGAPAAAGRGGADPLRPRRPGVPATARPGARLHRRTHLVGHGPVRRHPAPVPARRPHRPRASVLPAPARSLRHRGDTIDPRRGSERTIEQVAARPVMSADAVARRLTAFGFSRRHTHPSGGGGARRRPDPRLPADGPAAPPPARLAVTVAASRPRPPRTAQPRRPPPSAFDPRVHLPRIPRGRPTTVPDAGVQPDTGRGHRAQSGADRHPGRRHDAHPHGP